MMIRSVVTALVAALVLAGSGPASAQLQKKCIAGKTKCMSKKATGLLKCEATAETPGKTPDPNAGGCVTKVVGKFDGGAEPAKGCFEKLEGKSGNDCVTSDDTGAAEDAVDSCVASLVAAIDPPPITQTKCGAGKKKCVSKLFAALLKCNQVAQTPGKSTDPNAGGCVDKAKAKYNGADPAKGCFAKLEAKPENNCQFPGDSGALQTLVEGCASTLAALVTTPTTTTTTATSSTTTSTTAGSTTTTTMPSGGTVLKGALTATPGRFNYNLTLGLPGANAACNTNFPGTHACTYAELQSAEAAGDLVGLMDVGNNPVASFWAIDGSQPALQQCQDDVSSFNNWEYATAHTASRGNWVELNNGPGTLGTFHNQAGGIGMNDTQCNFANRWVGCCVP